ncbi:DNA-directed RNA polymerase subunit H [Methanobrevibacter filiformis]|uniref:DNA-directed RNA polymerase subunit Rpo5 n=1 Tax=Methanobrevibacter filiformis TaxID=55758 RepID=A0A166EIB7_9EURY|nr:DNA-directed RNA polymerase subunit H [Methanobrevibacter filiformis]KZX16683.1 DNA-directed RNA polymerase subunit H [Methanobrevibacter filiformis]
MKRDILKHELVPDHEILAETELKKIFKDADFTQEQLPKIKIDDPVVKEIDAKVGDVLQITRKSSTAGTFVTYRIVDG